MADPISETTPPISEPARLLVWTAPMEAGKLQSIAANLCDVFPAEELIVVTTDGGGIENYPSLKTVAASQSNVFWALASADFANVFRLAQEHNAKAVLMLGQEADSLSISALRELTLGVLTLGNDLATSHYDLPPRTGLVNSAILYPLSRALFASRARFPLAVDLAMSLRMAERLALIAQRFTAIHQGDSLLWPISEAAVAGFRVQEFDVGSRTPPQPSQGDLNTILAEVTGSLFADIEAKASFWQRPRHVPPPRKVAQHILSADSSIETGPMLDAFRLAYTNLQEVWSLVLTPNSLLGLKRLYTNSAATFQMSDLLWVRIIYDFLIAYRTRTINRGHLLGALTPLYLAWAASHINSLAAGAEAERLIESLATVFETEKPYLVSRWRWPDRFNP